jgi:hypothetical protein
VDEQYAAEVEQNVRDMQLQRQTDRQAAAVKAIQEANTANPEIGTWLH